MSGLTQTVCIVLIGFAGSAAFIMIARDRHESLRRRWPFLVAVAAAATLGIIAVAFQ